MKYIALFCIFVIITEVISLDVVQNKTGAEQVQDALKKAEDESNTAAKVQNNETKNSNETKQKDTKNFSKLSLKSDDEIDIMIAKKMAQLQKLRERHRQLIHEKANGEIKETAKELNEDEHLVESFKKAQQKEKENSELEEASDKKMVQMAKRLNHLVLKFQKKIGHISHKSKAVLPEDEDDSTKKIARGGPLTQHGASAFGGIDVNALRRALGLLKSKSMKLKSADDTNAKASYKEDVKLEDRLALEAEEEKKVTNSDNFDDDSAAETAAGVDKSSLSSSLTSETNSMSPKEQASQEMQSYNALISTESNRELTQIQDEINKATQSSMGKVSVVGQRENVQTESSALPGIPGLGGEEFGGAGTGSSLDGLLNGGGGGGGGNDPLAAALAAGNSNENNIESNAAAGADLTASQTTSINDFAENQQQQQQPGAPDASLNLGGQQPIEVGSSQPVDMGMYGGAANQQAPLGPENGGGAGVTGGSLPEEMQSSLNDVQSQQMMTGEQGFDQSGMSYKKSKISKKMKKRNIKSTKSNHFIKGKNFKRTVPKKVKSH